MWLAAAGLLMPARARLLGVAVPLPNLPAAGLVAHLAWGVTVGGSYRTVCAAYPRFRPDGVAGSFRRVGSGPG